jgi:hypothetical protein
MRVYKPLCLAILITLGINRSYSQCEDPEFIQVIGTCENYSFNLCLDRYTLTNPDDAFIMNVVGNDIGTGNQAVFDPCDSELISTPGYPKFGSVFRLSQSDCRVVYQPNLDAPTIFQDTFYYAAVIKNTCSIDYNFNYCDINDPNAINGRIWTIYSQYIWTKDVAKIEVIGKQGPDNVLFETLDYTGAPLQTGGYFYVDGSGLRGNQTNWTFRFYYTDATTQDVDVHTSCSFQIFGTPHPVNPDFTPSPDPDIFTPIAGCVETGGGKNQIGPDAACPSLTSLIGRNGVNVRENVTSQTIDTTLVVLTLENTLPLRIGLFDAQPDVTNNNISWTVVSSVGEYEMTLEKSFNGFDFYPLKSFYNIEEKTYEYKDSDIQKENHYYRIKSLSYNGEESFSTVQIVKRNISSGFKIFPNPTNGELNIQVGNGSKDFISLINIYDMAGKRIYNKVLNTKSTNTDLQLKSVERGLYLLEVHTNNGNQYIKKIIVQ